MPAGTKTCSAFELHDLANLDADLSLIGFSENELAQAMNGHVRQGLTDEDAAPLLPETPISRLGDTWLLGPHRVLRRLDVAGGRATSSW